MYAAAGFVAQRDRPCPKPPHITNRPSNEAVPFVDIISPTAVRVHGSGFILILDGAGFGPHAEIGFQLGKTTHPLRTLVVNEGEIAAYVPAGLLHEAATASINVTNHYGHDESVAEPDAAVDYEPTASVALTRRYGPGENPAPARRDCHRGLQWRRPTRPGDLGAL